MGKTPFFLGPVVTFVKYGGSGLQIFRTPKHFDA